MGTHKNTAAWTAAIVVCTAGFLLLITRPQMTRIKSAVADVLMQCDAKDSSHELNAQIVAAETTLERLKASVSNFDERVPADDEMGLFLQEISAFTARFGIEPDVVEPGEPIESKEVVALPVRMSVRGSFDQIFGLVREIEQMERLTLVEQFETSVKDERTGEVAAEFQLWVYFKAL